ncbi:MAG: MBL fold metallo-hydrolase [Bdellovibrionales bacterium]|nr:MBL fold metallo-hydrolase [Bdellovibrionales bacterium]
MRIKDFYNEPTNTLTYLVYDEESKDAVIIDPVLDYDLKASKVRHDSARGLLKVISDLGLRVHYILETHAHADHLTSAQFLKKELPDATTAIHENITLVQKTFKGIFNFDDSFETEGKTFDRLLKDGDRLEAGTVKVDVIHTPGHTPACVSFLVNEKAVFTGDALFMPDFGTGRCDFPKGSADDLYTSVHEKLYRLPDDVEVYVGHDYQPGGRELKFRTTIGAEKRENIQLKEDTTRSDYVKFRTERDSKLEAPKLLLPSIQVNAQNGIFPKPENNGVSYLKLPVRLEN